MKRCVKNLKRAFLGAMLLILLGTVGCKRQACYHCYAYSGAFEAIKAGDTIDVGFMLKRGWFQDSVTRYISLGYTIDTFANAYYPDPPDGSANCDLNSNPFPPPVPDSCVFSYYEH